MNTINIVIKILALFSTLLLNGARCGPTVRIEMDEAGMHRQLKYSVQFDEAFAFTDCQFMLAQMLPAAVYISTDELDDLQRLNRLSAVYPKFVDIEMITEKAQSFNVLLRGSAKMTERLTLPIHFRYHAASDKHSKATVVISTPKLYLNCPIGDNESDDIILLAGADKLYCLNEPESRFEEQQHHLEADEDCNWQQVRVDYELKKPLYAEIPVGNANGYTAVLYATIVLSWAVAIWTVLRTQTVPRSLNKQLNEQRLLQQQEKVKVEAKIKNAQK